MAIKVIAQRREVKLGKNPSIQITCLDEDGTVLKRVTSGDSGDVEDNDDEGSGSSENGSGSGSGSSDTPSGDDNPGADNTGD